jgi:RNA polymerase sigma-70 factor (ECF subfamily)
VTFLALSRPLPHPLSQAGASWYGTRVPRDGVIDMQGFAAAMLAEVDALHQFAWRLARRANEAEDLVQETFARAIAARAQFREGSNLKAWLFRILRNIHIDAVRRDRRNPVTPSVEVDDGGSDDGRVELLRGDLEIERLRRVVADDIEAALFQLSEEARTVVLLDLEGFSESEIAEVMGTAPGTVKSRLSRARAHLRTKLAEYAK